MSIGFQDNDPSWHITAYYASKSRHNPVKINITGLEDETQYKLRAIVVKKNSSLDYFLGSTPIQFKTLKCHRRSL
jgi:hypothetical protein